MGEEEVALVRRSLEVFISGDRDAGWSFWADDAVGIPPADWPEGGELRGRDAIRRQFDGWNAVFGEEWTRSMRIEALRDLGDGRILAELGFESTGAGSGVRLADQELAAIYTVRGEEIVHGDFFMGWRAAREAAGLE